MRLAKISTKLFLLVMLYGLNTVYGAHIVVGDFSYKHISGDIYEFKMKMYRDCGGGGAQFENFLIVGIYDKETNIQIDEIRMPRKTI